MASPTPAQAAPLARPTVRLGLAENAPPIDQILPLFPWKSIDGYEERVVGVAAADLGTATFLGSGAATTEDAAIPTSPAPTYPLRRIVRDVIIDSFLVETRSADVDLVQVEVDAAFCSIRYALADAIINGSSAASPPQIQGMKNLPTAGQIVGAADDAVNGGAVTLADFNRLVSKIVVRNRRPDFIVVNSATYRKWLDLHYASHLAPQVARVCNDHVHACPACDARTTDCPGSRPVHTHGGVPVLISDYIKSDETKGSGTNLTSAYTAILGDGVGLCLTYPSVLANAPFKVIRIYNPYADQERYRVTLNVGLSLYATGALARLDGIA